MRKFVSNNPSLSDKDAHIIGSFISKKFNGQVTPKKLLNEARDPKSVLHQYFDWDDESAADKYRLSQARNLIVSIRVQSDFKEPMRSFMRVKLETGATYMDCFQIKDSPDLIDQVVTKAHEELLRWKDRYGKYCDFFEFNLEMKGAKHVIKKDE